jgi:hypothetical protein
VSDVWSSREVKKARPFDQSPSKLFGVPSLIHKSCEALRIVVTEGVMRARTRGGWATSFTSLLLNNKNEFPDVPFVELVASAGSDSRLNLLESVDVHCKGVDDVLSFLEGGGAGGSEG